MKESETVKDHSSRIIEVVNQMQTNGETILDQKIVKKVLISLPKKYDSIIATIEESKDLATLSIEQLMGSLQSHEQRRLRRANQSLENAFQSQLTMKSCKYVKKGDLQDQQRRRYQRNWRKGDSSNKEGGKFEKKYGLK